jgi:hypothetical protein
MEPALIVILGVMGPLILISIIGIIYGLYTNNRLPKVPKSV